MLHESRLVSRYTDSIIGRFSVFRNVVMGTVPADSRPEVVRRGCLSKPD